MTIWDYWGGMPPRKENLRLLVPDKGWVAFVDRVDDEGKAVEGGSKGDIESVLINALSASNFTSLLGAGASFCAHDHNGARVAPSMVDLWNSVEVDVGAEKFAAVCARFPKAKLEQNIEKLLSLCKVFIELNDNADADDRDVNQIRTFVATAEQSILTRVGFVDRRTSLPSHEIYVRKIGRRGFRKTRAKLFTTNYDLAIEEAARRLRFTIIDGFSHSLDQVYDRQHYEIDLVRRDALKESPDYIPNVFQLYKLHGSADWRRIGSEIVRSRNNADGEPVLIYPRSSKYQEAFAPPYLDMMGAFQAALREPDTALVVLGFGFNDDHISRPIISALESNLSFRLVVCDPGFIVSENDLRGADNLPAHVIPTGAAPENPFMSQIVALAQRGDPRIHIINGRFEDLVEALPDLIGETDRERHAERVRILKDQGV